MIATTPHDRDSSAAPLILAAHYDTVIGSPGADDNASALAVLLDVARLSIAPFVASFEKLSFKQTHNFQKYSPLLSLNASS